MSDNIFGHIFKARSLAYKTDEYGELQEFKKRVKQEIDGLNECINPKFIMFKVTNKCNSGCVYCGYSAKNRHSSDNCMSEEKDKIQFEDFKRIIDDQVVVDCEINPWEDTIGLKHNNEIYSYNISRLARFLDENPTSSIYNEKTIEELNKILKYLGSVNNKPKYEFLKFDVYKNEEELWK